MKKLLFVAMLGLLGFISCKAAEAVRSQVSSLYANDSCGICGKTIENGRRVLFISPKSEYAHSKCFNIISPALETTYERLDVSFPRGRGVAAYVGLAAHSELVRLVQLATEPKTILEYAQGKEGVAKLKGLFDRYTQSAIDYGLAEKARLKEVSKQLWGEYPLK